jgi:CheY-like chemotaxis protein
MSPLQKQVIVVEDEPDTAEMFAEMMRLGGYHVIKSYGGRAAINLIAHNRPDAIILDIMLPSISGVDILRQLHRDPQLSKIPVIIVSAKNTPDDIQDGLNAGAAIYLTKPISYKDLKDAVDRAVRTAAR